MENLETSFVMVLTLGDGGDLLGDGGDPLGDCGALLGPRSAPRPRLGDGGDVLGDGVHFLLPFAF